MTWLADLKRVVEGRTPGDWEADADDGQVFDVSVRGSPLLVAEMMGNANARFIALLGSVADELVEVLEAVEECRELRGNPFSAENLDTALSRLAAAVERAKA